MSEVRKLPVRPRLFRGLEPEIDIPDVTVGRQLRPVPVVSVPTRAPVDLTGKPKIVFLIGSGNVGKSVLARERIERMLEHNPESSAVLAALDSGKRSLMDFFPADSVAEPEGYDTPQTAQFLYDLIVHCVTEKRSAIVDLGAGAPALCAVVSQSDICKTMEEGGVQPVACHVFGPRIDDLDLLATLHDAGFSPAAAMLVCNDGVGDPNVPFDIRFGALIKHRVVQSALTRGAMMVKMPRLPFAAATIEQRRLPFLHARDGKVPAWRKTMPLEGSNRYRVADWWQAMGEAFAPVASWWPE